MIKLAKIKNPLVCILLPFMLLTACTALKKEEAVTLTINYSSWQLFYTQMGYVFEENYPHIKIEVLEQSLNDDTYVETDIVFMNQISRYDTQKLHPLDALMKRDSVQFSDFSPVVTALLKDASQTDGNIYGLSPYYQTSVIYYNKTLFNKYNVDLPKNRMSWAEVLERAGQFPSVDEQNNRLYGFVSNYYEHVPISLILRAGQTEGLSFINPETLGITVNTERWRTIGEAVITTVEKGALLTMPDNTLENGVPHEPIITGRAAMQLTSHHTAYNFQLYEEVFNGDAVDWGMVTVPVNPLLPEYSDYYNAPLIFGISAVSKHKEEAWEFIKFITTDSRYFNSNGEEIIQNGLPAKTEFIPQIAGHELDAFYMQKPSLVSLNPYDNVHYEIINAFKEAGQAVLDEMIAEDADIEAIFERLEQEGQKAIDAAKLKIEMNDG